MELSIGGSRGRGERCPTCKSREVDVLEYREITVTEHKTSGIGIVSAAEADVLPYD